MSGKRSQDTRILALWRVLFFAAVGFAMLIALLPPSPFTAQQLTDKALHFGAFAVLTALAVLAFPKSRLGMLFLGLSVLGLAIELLQAAPSINRDPEAMDFLVDVLAIALTLSAAWAARSFALAPGSKRAD